MEEMSFPEYKQQYFPKHLAANLNSAKELLQDVNMPFDELDPHSEFAQRVVRLVYEQACIDLRSAWIDYRRASSKAKRANAAPLKQWTPPSVDSGGNGSNGDEDSTTAKKQAPAAYEP